MNKLFIYKIGNLEFAESEPFGQAWKDAVEWAKHYHVGITRTVIDGSNKREEFFARGGIFLNKRFYTKEKEKIF